MSDWRYRAACRFEDGELFFPIGDTGPAQLQTDAAKAVCCRCPVIEQCLAWALDTRQDAGVWGGMSEDERRSLRRRRTRSPRNSVTTQPEGPARAEGPARDLARKHGARIVRQRAEGRQFYTIARDLCRPTAQVRQAHALVVAGLVTPLPEAGRPTRPIVKCGTRGGYQRHLRNGEPPCDLCRYANTSADRRLRATGTTKERTG